MNIERWTSGYKATATDWYDGETSISRSPIISPAKAWADRPFGARRF